MLETLPKLDGEVADPKSDKNMQPEYCKNETRSIKPEIMVAVGICTHLGLLAVGQIQARRRRRHGR
jgi:ubiquinol-cytochrome c reductase iron-sulfur subunit